MSLRVCRGRQLVRHGDSGVAWSSSNLKRQRVQRRTTDVGTHTNPNPKSPSQPHPPPPSSPPKSPAATRAAAARATCDAASDAAEASRALRELATLKARSLEWRVA